MVHSLKINAAWHFSESQNPFGMFLGCGEAWGAAWEKALRRIGEF
jgi:hypothetical protein